MPSSRALQIIGKMLELQGRCIGVLVADGSDVAVVNDIKKAVMKAGATVKIVAPKIGNVKLNDGSAIKVDGQLAGTPSVLFDAIAIVLSNEEANNLLVESAAIDFVRDAFGHLKAIISDNGGKLLLQKANVTHDSGVFDPTKLDAFIAAAKTRQWLGEKLVRILI